LIELNSRLGITLLNKWHAVIDFSAYFDTYLEPTTVLKDLTEKYIIISTDSCYNNSLDRIHNPIKESEFDIVEELKLVDLQN
jgi:predicted DNA binding protein